MRDNGCCDALHFYNVLYPDCRLYNPSFAYPPLVKISNKLRSTPSISWHSSCVL